MERAVVTGASGTFGGWICEGLLARGIETICVVRDAKKGAQLLERLITKFPSATCRVMVCDVSDHDDIRRLASELKDVPIDILINNAAVTPTSRAETAKGIEMQWACNVLGYHWMMKEMSGNLLLCSSPPARVVNVASNYAGGLILDDVEFQTREYDADSAYQASKQANRMMAFAWSRRLSKESVVVHSCHPGVATSAVSLGLGYDLDRSEAAARDGAKTPLFLALDPSTQDETGMYFSSCRKQRCQFVTSATESNALFDLLESYG